MTTKTPTPKHVTPPTPPRRTHSQIRFGEDVDDDASGVLGALGIPIIPVELVVVKLVLVVVTGKAGVPLVAVVLVVSEVPVTNAEVILPCMICPYTPC